MGAHRHLAARIWVWRARRETARTTRAGRADDADAATAVTEGGETAGAVYREVRVEGIRPNPKQPRSVFDEEALAELEARWPAAAEQLRPRVEARGRHRR